MYKIKFLVFPALLGLMFALVLAHGPAEASTYKEYIKKADELNDNGQVQAAYLIYLKALTEAQTDDQKIIALGSLAAAAYELGLLDESEKYCLRILSLNQSNAWAKGMLDKVRNRLSSRRPAPEPAPEVTPAPETTRAPAAARQPAPPPPSGDEEVVIPSVAPSDGSREVEPEQAPEEATVAVSPQPEPTPSPREPDLTPEPEDAKPPEEVAPQEAAEEKKRPAEKEKPRNERARLEDEEEDQGFFAQVANLIGLGSDSDEKDRTIKGSGINAGDMPEVVMVDSKGLKWYSYTKGLELAKELRKDMLISFTSDNCHWCKTMDKRTFANDAVSAYMRENFILVKVDTAKEKTISKSYKIKYIPAAWFINTEGQRIGPYAGFISAGRFLNILKSIKTRTVKR